MAGEIIKTDGIVLAIHPWSRTSHIVTWLTPDHGCVTTLVKGAVRPKSAFLGQYDLFYTCDLLYYARARGDMHALRETTPRNLRESLRGRWRETALAGYAADRVKDLAPANAEAAAIIPGTPAGEAAIAAAVDKAQRGWIPLCGFLSAAEREFGRRLKQLPRTRWIKTVPYGLPSRCDPAVEDSRWLSSGRELLLSALDSAADPPWKVTRDGCQTMNARNAVLCAGMGGQPMEMIPAGTIARS